MAHRVATALILAMLFVSTCAPLMAQDDPPAPGMQAAITMADDEQYSGRIVGVSDGQLQLAAEPPRSLPLSDVARIDVGAGAGPGGRGRPGLDRAGQS